MKNKYFAFEVATEDSYFIGVNLDENKLNDRFESVMALLDKGEDETHSLGEVEAENVESAMDLIRLGQWSYSQVV